MRPSISSSPANTVGSYPVPTTITHEPITANTSHTNPSQSIHRHKRHSELLVESVTMQPGPSHCAVNARAAPKVTIAQHRRIEEIDDERLRQNTNEENVEKSEQAIAYEPSNGRVGGAEELSASLFWSPGLDRLAPDLNHMIYSAIRASRSPVWAKVICPKAAIGSHGHAGSLYQDGIVVVDVGADGRWRAVRGGQAV
ncbi:hypothetical protein E6O75_ATG06640 [Venturia nashicola]|uniref:Uncharacterized protein n=1 Tax=Venturia nashicola TaxID=86259 RepID=A0A4Z1P8U8_9PEZI|nr:hypothetical protein E6O75_ATG06640 [Venturia nashicola]